MLEFTSSELKGHNSTTSGTTQMILLQYLSPVFLILATVTNIFTITVLGRLCRAVVPGCLYLTVGALCDMFDVWRHCGNEWIYSLIEVDIEKNAVRTSNSVCKIYPFLSYFTSHMSTWMMVSISIETGLCYLRPQRLHQISSFKRERAVMLLIIVLCLSLNMHYFWSYGLVNLETLGLATKDTPDQSEQVGCTRQGRDDVFVKYVLPILHLAFLGVIPLLIVTSFTVVMVIRWRKLRVASDVELSEYHSVRQVHRAVLALSMTYVLTLMPACSLKIWDFLSNSEQVNVFKLSGVKHFSLAVTVCKLLRYSWLCSKFFILLACLTSFRQVSCGLIASLCGLRKRNKHTRLL